MFNRKGLPKEEEVEKFLALSCWQVNDEFSLTLLRIFSSMFNGKGLPKEEDVKTSTSSTFPQPFVWESLSYGSWRKRLAAVPG
jgi:hypothetical protein